MIDDTQKLWLACTLCGEDDEAKARENSGEHPGKGEMACVGVQVKKQRTRSLL